MSTTLQRRYQAILDYEVDIGDITEEGARNRRAERKARTGALDGVLGDPWEEFEPMPGPELIRAERRLLEAMMAEPRFRDRWFESGIRLRISDWGLDDETYADAFVDEEILRPAIGRLPEPLRATFQPDDEWGLHSNIGDFVACFDARPVGLEVVPAGEGYRALMDWNVTVEPLVETVARRRAVQRISVEALWPAGRLSAMSGPDAIAAQQQLLEAVLGDRQVLDRWMTREIVIAMTHGPGFARSPYEIALGEKDEDIIADVIETLPLPERGLLAGAMAADDPLDRLSDLMYAIWTRLVDVRVSPRGVA